MILNLSDADFRHIFQEEMFYLPIRWSGVDFEDTLDQLFTAYIERVRGILPRGAVKMIERNCVSIKHAVGFYLNGFPAKAFGSICRLMERMMEEPLKVYLKTATELFPQNMENGRDTLDLYRVAMVSENTPYDRRRVFHTPYSLRSKVATNRYSIAGYPSLYLGTSLELCCEEINFNPHEGFALAARFKLDRNFEMNDRLIKVIELSIKPQDFWEEAPRNDRFSGGRRISRGLLRRDSVRSAYLLWYPLIAACSYIRVNKRDPFAAEYIIPQLLMQWTRSEMTPDGRGRQELIGIRYFSCASVKASDMGFDYVFPVSGKQLADQPYCPVLAKAFKLTKPYYIHEYDSIRECEYALKKDTDLRHLAGVL